MAFVHPISSVAKAERVLALLDRSKEWIIYPFGEKGKLVKGIVDVYYSGAIVADGKNNKSKSVMSLEDLQNLDVNNKLVLLCSDSEEYYNEIREQIFGIFPFSQVIDVFSNSMYYDADIYFSSVQYTDDRIAHLELAAREIYHNKVAGDIAECGVYKGGFSRYIARFLPDRLLYLFDTFSGFNKKDLQDDKLPEDMLDMFNDTTVEMVLNNIGHHVKAVVRKGWFPDTTVGLENNKYAFVSLDTDLYAPILAGLEYFWPRLSPGGYIFVHDFGGLQGVNRAVKEFCKRMHISYIRLSDYNTSAVLQKPL